MLASVLYSALENRSVRISPEKEGRNSITNSLIFSSEGGFRLILAYPNETTDENKSVLLRRKSFATGQGFSCVLLGAHASCVPGSDTQGTLEACAPRDDLCVLRVSAARFVLVVAMPPCVHRWFHIVQF